MNISILYELSGKIIKGINTTCDVHPDSIKKETLKFNNVVSNDGVPPTYEYGNIAKTLIEFKAE